MKHRRPQGVPSLGAQELAWLVLEIIGLGLERRSHRTCLGVDLVSLLPGVLAPSASVPQQMPVYSKRALRLAINHSRTGHDTGCDAFGVSITELVALLNALDDVGVAPVVLEALSDATDDILYGRAFEQWEQTYARESIELQLRRRITPQPPRSCKAGPEHTPRARSHMTGS